MISIEFGKKCRPYNLQYRDLFGYVPCRRDYQCSQDEYFEALLKAIETKKDISTFVTKRTLEPNENVRYSDFTLTGEYYEETLNGIVTKISKKNYNAATLEYAYKIAELYAVKKADVLDYVLQKTVEFYCPKYSADEIKTKLNDPYIEILSDSFGVLVWLNHQLDEHIIQCEFGNDMQLSYVSLDG